MGFEILKGAVKNGAAARLGRLAFAGRLPMDTPNYIGITSRGALPHLTPDTVSKHLPATGAYMALEDCELPSSIASVAPRDPNSLKSSSGLNNILRGHHPSTGPPRQ